MSLVFTESFYAFGTYNGSDAWATDGAPARLAYAANIARAGYGVYSPANTSSDTSGGFVVRADPVYPLRNALTHSSDAGAAVNLGVSAAFKRKIPITDKQIVIGFSMFVPSSYVPNSALSTVPVFRMNATANADAAWYAVGITPLYSAKEVFRISQDMAIRWGTDAAQSSLKVIPGQVNYLEVRIDPGMVSVWINDTFCMQKAVSLTTEILGFIFENNANSGVGGTNMSGAPGRWAMGNMYYMFLDGVAPTARLGPTTRVIGSRPDTDVDVRFIRPSGAGTNASVAGQDLVDQPPQQLQSTTVGDYDTYTTTVNQDPINSIAAMAMIHSVAVKVLAANLEPDIHNIKPYTKYSNSGEGADAKPRDLFTLGSGGLVTRNIRAMAIRPSDNSLWLCGDGESIYYTTAIGDSSKWVWTRVTDLGSANNYISMFMRSDGYIEFLRSDFKMDFVNPGTNSLVLGATAVGSASAHPAVMTQSPDGSHYVGWCTGTNSNRNVYTATAPGGPWTLLLLTTVGGSGVDGWRAAMTYGTQTLAMRTSDPDYITVATGAASAAANYAAVLHGDTGVNYGAVTHDGVQWLIGSVSNDNSIGGAPRIRSSTDGASWVGPTQVGSSIPGASQTLNFGVANTATHESMFGGNAGALVASTDGRNWRQLPRLTTQPLYAGVVMPNGDFVLGGGAGAMLIYKAPGTDTSLQPLAGYTMAFGSAVFNPKTNTNWTAAEASTALFGVRLTT